MIAATRESTEKPIAIVLGGTNPHVALIENLKNRGYHTVLIDYYPNPPARTVADEHEQESTLDEEKVLEIAKRRKAQLVIATCIDQANVTACYVAEKLGLPAPYSHSVALTVSDKGLMKERLLANGIPTSRFVVVEDGNDINLRSLRYPLVVKPVDSSGSKGVKKAHGREKLVQYVSEAKAISRTNKVIVEEYVKGKEVSADCFVNEGEAHVVMLREKYNAIDRADSVINYASLTPVAMSDSADKSIERIAQQIAHIFNLDTTSLLLQVLVDKGNVNVVEFAPRVSGGLAYQTVELKTGFDILDATVDSYLGIPVLLSYRQSEAYYAANNMYAKPALFGDVTGYKELIDEGIIHSLYYYKTKGMRIGSEMSSRNRVGSFIVEGFSREEICSKIAVAMDRLEVEDIYGSPMMRKDLFIRE